jgi:SAM-dependent methyltransferase
LPGRTKWEHLGGRERPSWYLDPLVAQQKRRLYRGLVRAWTGDFVPATVLKTDLFEEAFGGDHLLFDLLPASYTPLGMDVSLLTARRAKQICPVARAGFITADVRRLPIKPGTIDLIISTSTLDHFETREEFQASVEELAHALRPGGLLIISVDNPLNPLYHPLRWLSRWHRAPFPLGYTTSGGGLARSMEASGLEVAFTGCLIHNPRIVSTFLFLGLRRLAGSRADAVVRVLLGAFALLGRLPTRRFTACFVAACARKPANSDILTVSN